MSSNATFDELCERVEQTWNDRDLEGALALYTDDIVYRDFSSGGTLEGIDRVRRHVRAVFERFDMHWTVVDSQPFADRAGGMIFWLMEGGLKDGSARMGGYGCDHVRIRDGKYCYHDIYFDSAQLSSLLTSVRDLPRIARMLPTPWGPRTVPLASRALFSRAIPRRKASATGKVS